MHAYHLLIASLALGASAAPQGFSWPTTGTGASFPIPASGFGGGFGSGSGTGTGTSIPTGGFGSGFGSGSTGGSFGSTGSSTANDLVDGKCGKITVIFARGTGETGNMGTVAGPPWVSAMQDKFGADAVAVQGVDYAASAAGNTLTGDPDGNAEFASLCNQAASQCPDTQIVVGGYSQGGIIVHNGAKQIDSGALDMIKACVVFGDPLNGQTIEGIGADKVKSICAQGDPICGSTGTGSGSGHLSYGSDAGAAADFVASKVSV